MIQTFINILLQKANVDIDAILNDSGVPLEIKEKLSFLNNNTMNLENQLNFLQHILNELDDFIVITDLAGNIEFANSMARTFYGDLNGNFIGSPCFLLKTMEGYPTFKEIFDIAIAEGFFQQVIPVESRSEKNEEKYHYLSLKVSLTADQEGKNISLFWSGRDVCKSVKMEMEVIQSENYLNRLIANIPGVVYRCDYDQNWTMRYISEGAQRLFGYTPEDLIDNKKISFSELIREDYRQIVWEKWQEDMKKQVSVEFEYPIITASGEERWILDRSQKIEDENGNIESIEGIM